MHDILKRLRKQKRIFQDGKWVDTVEPVNPDGPEAADIIEKLQYDFLEAIRMSKEEAFLRGIADGRHRTAGIISDFDKRLKAQFDVLVELVRLLRAEKATPGDAKNSDPISIGKVAFSARVHNCLRNHNIKTLEDIALLTPADLLRMPNFGLKSVTEVKEVLADHGMTLNNGEKSNDPRIERDEFGLFLRFSHED